MRYLATLECNVRRLLAISYAMECFGTIVPGLETFYKSLAYGGVAAVLQHGTSKAVWTSWSELINVESFAEIDFYVRFFGSVI